MGSAGPGLGRYLKARPRDASPCPLISPLVQERGFGGFGHRRASAWAVFKSASEGCSPWPRTSPLVQEEWLRPHWASPGCPTARVLSLSRSSKKKSCGGLRRRQARVLGEFEERARGAPRHVLLLIRSFKKKGCGGVGHHRTRDRAALESAPVGGSPWPRSSPLVQGEGLRRLWGPLDQGTGHYGARLRGALPWPRSSPFVQEIGLRQLCARPGWGRAALRSAPGGWLAMAPLFADRSRSRSAAVLGTAGPGLG